MPKALVVYESMFGNTETVARAVASGLAGSGTEVSVLPVAQARDIDLTEYDVVVVGGPTHLLGMSSPRSRADAVRHGAAADCATVGLREWIGALDSRVGARPQFAVFDTRVGTRAGRRHSGSAAHRAAKELHRRHRRLADPPASFYVSGTAGSLLPGEEVRARVWGARLTSVIGAAPRA